MVEAETPAENKPEETSPQSQTETPANQPEAEKPEGNEPATNQGTQPEGEAEATLESALAQVEELKGDNSKLSAQQSEADKRARKAERTVRILTKKAERAGGTPSETPPATPAEPAAVVVEDDDEDAVEATKAEKLANRLLLNPKYREVFDADPTLLSVLTNNPLFFVDDFIDSKDAVDQVTEMLDERLAGLKPAEGDGGDDAKPPAVDAGAPNPSSTTPKKDEKTVVNPLNEDKVTSSILAKLQKGRRTPGGA